MKYTSQIIVKIPLEEFIKKLNNHENMKHWQRDLESFEHVSGEPNKLGAKMMLNYRFGKRKMMLLETIIKTELPYKLHLNYETKGIHTIQQNYFEQTPYGYTKWISLSELIPTSFFMRAMTLFMPYSFKKKSMTYLKDFKKFAENKNSIFSA